MTEKEKTARELWSKIITSIGVCQRCGGTKKLGAAHILPKGKYKRFRFNLMNGLCLCFACHIHWAHKNPIDFTLWLKDNFPEKFKWSLKARKEKGKVRLDIDEIITELRSHLVQDFDSNEYRKDVLKRQERLRERR